MRPVIAISPAVLLGSSAWARQSSAGDQPYREELARGGRKRPGRLEGRRRMALGDRALLASAGRDAPGKRPEQRPPACRTVFPAWSARFCCPTARSSFEPAPGVAVTRNGKPFSGGRIFSDADEHPDTLAAGDVKLILLKRGERYAMRIKDNQSPLRTSFAGLRWYPPREEWRIQAAVRPLCGPDQAEDGYDRRRDRGHGQPGLRDVRVRREDLPPRGGRVKRMARSGSSFATARAGERLTGELASFTPIRRRTAASCSTSTRPSTCRARTFRTPPARSRRLRTG